MRKILSSGSLYYYYPVLNTRGDIIELHSGSGALSARYTYDSWGKLVSVVDGSGATIGAGRFAHYVSLRYRGYYYDAETELYYLQSRYYDPETGRFLNADDVKYIGYSGEQLSYNAFAYCENEPVCRKDIIGKLWERSIKLIFTVSMMYRCLELFLESYLNFRDYEIKSFSYSDSDFCRTRVWYKTITYKNRRQKYVTDNINIYFGPKDMWEYASTHIDTLFGLESVNEMLGLIDSTDVYKSIVPIIGAIITAVYAVFYNYELHSNYDKVYEYVWGSDGGLDPNDVNYYMVFCISGSKNEYKNLNGFHAYSYVTYDKREILL